MRPGKHRRPGCRVYVATTSRAGGFTNWPGEVWSGPHRMRVMLAELFRRYYGHSPSFTWHVDGREAEAWDDRGNRLALQQHNDR